MFWPDHIGIVVLDLDRSTRFYTALFGVGPLEKAEWRGENAKYVATMVGRPGIELDAVLFQIPYTNTILELVKYYNLPDQQSGARGPDAIGSMHLAFFVEPTDLEAVLGRLKQIGATNIAAVEIMHGPYKGGRTVYFRDPDNAFLQIMAVTRRPGGLPVLRPSMPHASTSASFQ